MCWVLLTQWKSKVVRKHITKTSLEGLQETAVCSKILQCAYAGMCKSAFLMKIQRFIFSLL